MHRMIPVTSMRRLLVAAAAAATLVGCADMNLTDPNQASSASFWKSADDANRGLTATYNALYFLGTYSRWLQFAKDIRSDIGTAQLSPWGDLANFNAFQFNSYDFDINRDIWNNNYELIGRANLVIAQVPAITMDETAKTRIVAQAKFLRGLGYYNLVTLWDNIPLVTAPPTGHDLPAQATPAEVWALIEKDFSEAAAGLPEASTRADAGRATKAAALAMLGKARLQQRKWAEAAQALQQVIDSHKYSLLPNYRDNFVESSDLNNPESLFEVQNEDMYPIGVTGMSFPKMIGPCYRPGPGLPELNPTFCDGRPTMWYLQQFKASRTATGGIDPRLEATLLYNNPDSANTLVYGQKRGAYFVNSAVQRMDTLAYFRKYGETYITNDQRWDNPMNYKVLRYADVLLMQAEALNEQGQPAQAAPYVNQVRARVGKSALPALSQTQMRDSVLYERMLELGLEASRWDDLRRQNLLSPTLVAHDPDFRNFVNGKSDRLPITTKELNLNPNVHQNPGW